MPAGFPSRGVGGGKELHGQGGIAGGPRQVSPPLTCPTSLDARGSGAWTTHPHGSRQQRAAPVTLPLVLLFFLPITSDTQHGGQFSGAHPRLPEDPHKPGTEAVAAALTNGQGSLPRRAGIRG